MANLNGFNANEVDPAAPRTPMPVGDYRAVIIASEEKANSARTGKYLAITFEVTDGQHKGRRQRANLNLDHPNPVAVSMARAELSSICRAVGVMQPRDSVELHNLPLIISVGMKKRTDTGELTNEITAYQSAQAVAAAPTTQPQGADAPPWQR